MGTKKGIHFGYQNLAAGTDFGTHFKRRFWYPFLVPKVTQILVPTGSCFEHPWPEYKPQARRGPTSVALHRRRSPRWSPTFEPLRCCTVWRQPRRAGSPTIWETDGMLAALVQHCNNTYQQSSPFWPPDARAQQFASCMHVETRTVW